MRYQWSTFLTDYGTEDGFVAACHGVVARIAPATKILDITHAVPPQDVRRGATLLAQTVPYCPPAVHLGVVDPGVGTTRRGIVIVTAGGLLVGPDNGLLLPAADALGGVGRAFELAAPAYRLPSVSATFHGRDVFAPAAAHLSLGVPPEQFGPPATDLVRLPAPLAERAEGSVHTEVLGVDHFGNLQLAARPELLATLGVSPKRPVRLDSDGTGHTLAVGATFADVPVGGAVLIADSAGLLAVAVNGGSARERFGLGVGSEVTLTPVAAEGEPAGSAV